MSSEERISIQDGRKPGWYWASNEVIDAYGAEMGPYGLAIYHALCRHANQRGESWPSYATLAKETGMKRRQAISTMARLVELELISKQARKDEAGDPKTNLYTLLEVGGSAPRALGVVNEVHQGSAPPAPEQDSINKNHLEEDSCSSKESLLELKILRLKDLGINEPKRSEIAQYRGLLWIESARRYATKNFKDPNPAAIVHLHDTGWEPEDYEVEGRPYVLARIEREYGIHSPMLGFYGENYGRAIARENA